VKNRNPKHNSRDKITLNSIWDLAETFTLNETKEMLELEPEDFDQSELGRRKYEENPGKAIYILKHYLEHYNFGNTEEYVNWKQRITFHLWQCYAVANDYANALLTFQKLKQENCTEVGEAYLTATILFLDRDKAGLTSLREVVKDLDENICPNIALIERYYLHFDKSYQEAYASE
jgi:hypothetical protein